MPVLIGIMSVLSIIFTPKGLNNKKYLKQVLKEKKKTKKYKKSEYDKQYETSNNYAIARPPPQKVYVPIRPYNI